MTTAGNYHSLPLELLSKQFLYNQPCQIITNLNTLKSVFIRINSKQGRIIVKVQESIHSEISAAFLF